MKGRILLTSSFRCLQTARFSSCVRAVTSVDGFRSTSPKTAIHGSGGLRWLGTETVFKRQVYRYALKFGHCELLNRQSVHGKQQTLGHEHECCGSPFSLHVHMHVAGDCVIRTRELFLEEFHERRRKDIMKADFCADVARSTIGRA